MSISRREVVRLAQALVASVMLPQAVFAADLSSAAPQDSLKKFQAVVGTQFTANRTSLTPTWLVLSFVQDMTPSPSATAALHRGGSTPEAEAFALNFTAVGAPLTQSTYEFEHDSLGKIAMFVVPQGSGYVAIFNLLRQPVAGPRPVIRNRP